MRVTVNILEHDSGGATSITIDQIEGTSNYHYIVGWAHEKSNGIWGGIIYNFEGSYYELVKKVMNGRDLS